MPDNEEEKIIKVPRFEASNGFYTTKARSSLMAKIKAKNTSPEILFRKALWKEGIRYRVHNAKLPGNPDIFISKHNIVIFIDGGFWHGYDWENKKNRIKSNRDFWIAKIERNMQRDKANNEKLRTQGYMVFRFWEKDIKKNLQDCISSITSLIIK